MKAIFLWKIKVAAAIVLAAAVVSGGGTLAAEKTAAAEPLPTVTVLNAKGSFFRWMRMLRPAVLVAEPGATERLAAAGGKKIDARAAEKLSGGSLPAKWAEVDFDDSLWPRTAGSRVSLVAFGGNADSEAWLHAGVLYLRGKFNVTDPAAANPLNLTLSFRGGAVVYLNGKEVARSGMPDGAITPATPALPYPLEVYANASRSARDRTLGPLALPAQALRKGANVLAVELHRSDYHTAVKPGRDGNYICWNHCGLLDLKLTAAGGAAPNCGRPQGVQVWNQDCNDRTSVYDYGDPNEELRPIVITAARNGVFSGRVVVSSDKALGPVKAESGELKLLGGNGVIPASAVQVHYARAVDFEASWRNPFHEADERQCSGQGRRARSVSGPSHRFRSG